MDALLSPLLSDPLVDLFNADVSGGIGNVPRNTNLIANLLDFALSLIVSLMLVCIYLFIIAIGILVSHITQGAYAIIFTISGIYNLIIIIFIYNILSNIRRDDPALYLGIVNVILAHILLFLAIFISTRNDMNCDSGDIQCLLNMLGKLNSLDILIPYIGLLAIQGVLLNIIQTTGNMPRRKRLILKSIENNQCSISRSRAIRAWKSSLACLSASAPILIISLFSEPYLPAFFGALMSVWVSVNIYLTYRATVPMRESNSN